MGTSGSGSGREGWLDRHKGVEGSETVLCDRVSGNSKNVPSDENTANEQLYRRIKGPSCVEWHRL